MGAVKVATCCYCGTKAALVLRGKSRHELACGSCGAPLHHLKMLPIAPDRATAPAAAPTRPEPSYGHRKPPEKPVSRPGKRRKTRSFGRKVWSGVWDALEDVLEDVFD